MNHRSPNILRRVLLAPIGIALILSAGEAVAQDALDLPVIGVAVVDTLWVDGTGIRGIAVSKSAIWILTSEHTGRAMPDSSYVSAILSWDPSTGAVDTLLSERDSFGAGLAYDGEALWVGGNPVGGFEAIYRVDPATGVADRTLPSSGYHAGGLAWANEYLWQVDSSARQISRIETEEGKLSRRLQAPGFYPTGVAHDGRSLYCADAATGLVYRMRAQSGRADGVLDPGMLRFAGEFVTLVWDQGYLWIARDTDDFVVRYQILP